MLPYIFAAVSGLVLVFSPSAMGSLPAHHEKAFPPETNSFLPVVEEETPETMDVWVTAYSSTPEETDDTPFLTARNTETRDGIVAANFLPFGTKLQIPEHFGDKVFTVEDRMHRRKTNFVDVWMPTKEDAKRFGISYTSIIILERGHEVVARAE
jgi:3D (Asp-Asp-Asp) domain-containing protein